MACSDECCSLCSESFILDLKRMVQKQSKRINDYISYVLKYIAEDYTLTLEDVAGDILIISQGLTDTKVFIPLDNVGFNAGCSVSIVQDSDAEVKLVGAEGVTFTPPDAVTTRRKGSAITLIYEGEQLWRIVGNFLKV